MKKTILAAGVVLILILCAFFVVFQSISRASIPIGLAVCLSGRLSQMGIEARNGAELAVKEQNHHGGLHKKPIELLVRNNEDDPVVMSSVVRELADNKVKVIIGPLVSKMALPAIEAARGKDVIFISPTVSADGLKNQDDCFLRIGPVASGQATTLIKRIRQHHKRVAIVYDISNDSYTLPMLDVFKTKFAEEELQLYEHPVKSGSGTAFLEIAENLKTQKADALVLCVSGVDAASLCQQIRKIGFGLKIYATSWAKTNHFISHGGKAVEGVILVSGFEAKTKNSAYQVFYDNYLKAFQAEPSFISVRAYEAVQIAISGIKAAKRYDALSIKKAIIAKGLYTGLEQSFTVDAFGDSDRGYSFFEVRDGGYKRID